MLTLPTDQASWAHAGQTGVLLVPMEGEVSEDLRTRTRQWMQAYGIPQGTTGQERPVTDAPMSPPALLVEASKPCETCGGRGTLKRLSTYRSGTMTRLESKTVACLDCHNGKRRITVQVPCKRCEGRRTIQTYDGDLGHLTQPCPDCQMDPTKYEWSGATGQVTVGTVVHKWGPLVVGSFPMLVGEQVIRSLDELWYWPSTAERPLVVDTPGGLQFTDPDVLTPPVDPATWIGKYVSAFEVLR